MPVDIVTVEELAFGSAVAVIGLVGVFWEFVGLLRIFRLVGRQFELVVRFLGAAIPISVATFERL